MQRQIKKWPIIKMTEDVQSQQGYVQHRNSQEWKPAIRHFHIVRKSGMSEFLKEVILITEGL